MPERRTPNRRVLGTALAAAAMLIATGATVLTGTASAQQSALAPTAGCGKSPTLRDGNQTIQSGGQNRSYILRLPANYNSNQSYRLVVGLHWLNGSANDVVGNGFYGLQQQSNNTAIFVAPQGLDAGWANTGGRDVTLVDDILRVVENALCVDTSQRFALGFSYGGAMSFTLACARPAVFRAVAPIAGANLSGGCSSASQPVAYFGIHGTRDSVLNISMGRSIRDVFVRANGCTAQNPPEPGQGSGTHITTAYAGCRAGYPVQWAAHDGDHVPLPTDRNSSTSWVSSEVWRFFTQFGSTTPPSSPAPSNPGPSTPGTTTPPPGGTTTCRATSVVNAWNNGLTANVTVTNTGSSAINGWTLAFTLPSGQTITGGWNATYSPTSGRVTATNVGHNASLAPGASASFGFQATHSGNNGAPSEYALNGAACATA
ncbi:cellulose binding domain-containing protein [Jidongwangia harbinensis]|uniref:cellulose binding domain-containing protein n=1 Tax=Jidongwangia harbinensis TaxID=2878561 RepID=UPI001CD9FC1D|nr:cellulose binding domain-containing protein [Jidongwangia harbinensis]MCA2219550.1 cellulose binding domain-containing protein [Jidongwangia harbinensis]